MEKAYQRINWENEPSVATPINETNLNKMDSAINTIDNRVVSMDTTKANEADMLLAFNAISFDENTGIFTFTRKNGTTVQIDTLLEKVVTNFEYIDDPDDPHYQHLKLTLKDGTVQYIDLSAFISIYEFIDTNTIGFTVVGGKVKAEVIDGSITQDKLQPDYLADITAQANAAAASASDSAEEALVSEGYAVGEQNGVPVTSESPYYHNNAKYYSQQADVTSLAALTDVDINNPEDKQALVYDETTQKWINGDPVGGGILPKLIISSETGSTVTVTDGVTVLTPIEDSGTWITEVPNFGSWVVSSTNAQGTATNTVNVDTVKIYNVNVSHFTAHITVTFPEGATASAVNGAESYTSNTTPHTFDVHSTGTWTISATRDGETVSTTVNITTDGQTETVTLSMATILLTVDEDFMGDTVVLSDGNNTKSWVVNSTTHVFTVSFGTWTASITKSGSTYSSASVTVNAYIQYEAYIASWNYKAWLDAAGIADTFGSLAAVLASEPTLRILMTKHASVDYMIEWCEVDESNAEQILDTNLVAKWVNLRDYCLDKVLDSTVLATLVSSLGKYGYGEWALVGQVPKMTSNTAPYGTAFSSSNASGREPYKAFDGDNSTSWITSSAALEGYIGYAFNDAIKINKARIRTEYGDKYVTIKYSDDNSNWIVASDTISATEPITDYDIDINTDTAHRYWRADLQSISGETTEFYVDTLQFYSWQPKGAVPIMTSNTAPYGVASTDIGGANAYYAFDNNASTNVSASSDSGSGTITYKFVNPTNVRRIGYGVNLVGSSTIHTISVSYSDDGSSWNNAVETMEYGNTTEVRPLNISDYGYHLYWRINVSKSANGRNFAHTLQFYGRQLSVSVPKMTSNTAPWGEAFGSPLDTSFAGAYFGLVFNKDESTNTNNVYIGTNRYAGYKFSTPIRCKLCYIMNEVDSPHNFSTGKVQASNDGINWTDISEVVNGVNTAGKRFYITCNPTMDYRYYRFLELTVFSGDARWTIQQLNFYGLDYSEHDERHWIYDHGVELEQTEALLMQTGCAEVEKQSDCLYMKGKVNDQNGNITTSNAIDLTTYNLMRVISGNEFVNIDQSTGRNQLVVRSSKTALGNVLAYTYISNTDLPNGLFISVASVNQNSYVMLFVNKNGAIFTAKEWWLE